MKRFWFVLLAPLSALLTLLGHRYPDMTERWFSQGLYRMLAESYGRVFGYLPFSIAQFLIILLPGAAVIYAIREVWRIIKIPGGRKKYAIRLVANASCTVGVIWFMFTMLCGLNYTRMEFALVAGLEIRQSSVAELVALCEEIAGRTNGLSFLVARDENGQMVLSAGSSHALAEKARTTFQSVTAEYPVLGGFCPRPKPILYSRFMSRLNIVGIYSPFTMEANVNTDICDYNIQAVMAHELAHFKGFMREDEANFIAWLVCRASGEPDFMYSGEMLALVHAARQLRRVSDSDYQRIMNSLSEGVWADLHANNEYWKQFEGPMAEISTTLNDTYLKANRQTDGILSYGRMVDLLLSDYRKRHEGRAYDAD